ncbi:MAG: rRNA maturation RNase YbeY [Deltaproteobacteria bacterium]|nr:rRNA maturation RNase YbeY [Deltaproteobacteria bacterium]
MPVSIIDEAGFKKSALIKKIAAYALSELGKNNAEVSVLITGNDGIQSLNKKFRRMDRPTDVLSFPMNDADMLGDVVMSKDKVISQSKEFNVSADEELARLFIHGILHLLGFDHVKGGTQAKKMKAKEEELLRGVRGKGWI